jgi:hypothetical protein
LYKICPDKFEIARAKHDSCLYFATFAEQPET